jgi:hypothetical protein
MLFLHSYAVIVSLKKPALLFTFLKLLPKHQFLLDVKKIPRRFSGGRGEKKKAYKSKSASQRETGLVQQTRQRSLPHVVVGFRLVVLGVVVSLLSDSRSRAQTSQGSKITQFSPKRHNGGSLVT